MLIVPTSIQRIFFYIGRALTNIRSNILVTLITISTITVSLLILSLFFLFSYNAFILADTIKRNIQISVYFNENVSAKSQENIRQLVGSFEGVKSVELISIEKARDYFIEQNEQFKALIGEFAINPFPASLEIKVHKDFLDPARLDIIVAKLKKLPYFDEIIFGRTWTEYLLSFIRVMNGVGMFVGGMLLVAVMFIIHNIITLGLHAKKDELEIINLVGGSRIFLSLPYLIEAVFDTFFSAIVALVVLRFIFELFNENITKLFSIEKFAFLPWYLIVAIILGSCLLGLFGCALSLLQFRKRLA